MMNKLNDLDGKAWLLFQKSWFIHNPPPRKASVLRHPAKFPETMVQEFIEFFTKRGERVLDPMAGTGSAIVAAYRAHRTGIGTELNPSYVEIANQWLEDEGFPDAVYQKDARDIKDFGLLPIDYVITSPPYWDMLKRTGHRDVGLDVVYSEEAADVANIDDYDDFVKELISIYCGVATVMRPGAYITIIVKNVKKEGTIYPLAWDLGKGLHATGNLTLKDEKIWCQDNQKLAPYGMGSAWVSNTFHHYCLNFRKQGV